MIIRLVLIAIVFFGIWSIFLRGTDEVPIDTKTLVEESNTTETVETDKSEEDKVTLDFPETGKLPTNIGEKLPSGPVSQDVVATPQVETVRGEVVPEPVNYEEVTVKAFLYDNGLDLSTKSVSPGIVHFEVHNNGFLSHEFAVLGGNYLGKVLPGKTEVFSVLFTAGEYELYSPHRDDLKRGLQETFYVRF
jgi:hypothetical protein